VVARGDPGGPIGGRPATRAAVADAIARRLLVVGVIANVAGAGVVFAYLGLVFEPPEKPGAYASVELNAVVLGVVLVLGGVTGTAWALHHTRGLRAWARTDAPPGEPERVAVLGLPRALVRLTATQWGLAVVIFGSVNATYSFVFALETATTIVLGGLVTGTAAWLFSERELRPAVAVVLESRPPRSSGALGIAPRILLTWVLCSGVPLIGLALVPIGRDRVDSTTLVGPIAFIVVVALVAGSILMTLVMRSVAGPVGDVRRAMETVAAGSTDVRVTVDDASEVGRLQAGFNEMVEGLAERERLQDLFGRQVGLDVAREALARGTTLGGEEETVGALFVDVLGSTQLTAREPPERVVALLNDFFAIVVETVERHGGFVNKFQGDGALCIFGAPAAVDGVATRTLTAARALAERLAPADPLDAAIGVSCGRAVAGHVGAESRYEYTVIGMPVNEAARLTELAKARPERLLAAGHAVRQASSAERAAWRPAGHAVLRGHPAPTDLAVPAAYTRSRGPE
jgi:adenylate cyclase